MELRNTTSQNGFALLMSLIVVSVVISIGLSVLDLSLKQLRLSTNSKDSESAFHAAGAGLGCARHYRTIDSADMETGAVSSVSCFSTTLTPSVTSLSVTDGAAYLYDMEATWGALSSQRCSQMKTLVFVSATTSTTTVTGMETLIPGYPYGDTKSCEPGARCTVISVRGYSKACSAITLSGTVQREVLLEL